MALLKNKVANRILFAVLGLAGLTVLVVYVIVPLLFVWFPGLMRSFIFVPDGKIKDEELPQFLDYEHPEKVGFVGARNFYVESMGGAKLGVWHTLPSTTESEGGPAQIYTDEGYRELLKNATVFLYLHGSAGTRTSSHRRRAYKLLNKIGCHVVALDYRGYGDSTGFAYNETNLVDDAKAVYSWIRERVTSGHIFLWGHSLGTGVAAHLADVLFNLGEPLAGIVMEASYDNMADAVRVHPLAKMLIMVPWFDYCLTDPLYKNDMAFVSDKHLARIPTPVLLLHAKDDQVIPYDQSVKLYEATVATRKDPSTVQLITYDASLGYGHYNIIKDPNLNTTVRQFVDEHQQ